ncbi:MAG: RNA polymerase sigma factor [Anaerolineae bacterium]|nr:RNA polymerase sigma factor [Anaerolineae bacterium]
MLTFHELYDTYAQDVYRFAYWLAGDPADAEDITSETFIRAWVSFDATRTETLKAYLLKIARNTYLQQLRKRKKQTRLEDVHADPNPGPEKLTEARAELSMVRELLQSLPEIDRAAFVLRVQHDLPYDEIARVLQLSVGAAKVKVHRIRKRLLMARMGKETV